jgi:hypothetical protein
MPYLDSDTFTEDRRSGSTNAIQGNDETLIDIISLIATVHHLKVDLLSLVWQTAREPIGWGGTSQVNEALVDIHTSFAFKRVSEKRKLNRKKADILRDIIHELSVLSDPSIRQHPKILEIQGVCWDVPHAVDESRTWEPQQSDVWPVLVFEKSQYGDLKHFVPLPVGRQLHICEKLNICVDIGIAISSMHRNRKHIDIALTVC